MRPGGRPLRARLPDALEQRGFEQLPVLAIPLVFRTPLQSHIAHARRPHLRRGMSVGDGPPEFPRRDPRRRGEVFEGDDNSGPRSTCCRY